MNFKHQIMKVSVSGYPCAEYMGLIQKLIQRLEEEARAEWERKIPPVGVTGEVIHEGRLLRRWGQQQEGKKRMNRVLKQDI